MTENSGQNGSNLFLIGAVMAACSVIVLITVFISWMIAGQEYKDAISGNEAIVASLVGLTIGGYLAYRGHRQEASGAVGDSSAIR